MTWEVLLALTGFSLVSSITPGPNNLMLLSSGVNYGFARSIPHMIGISLGFGFLLLCVGLGLGELLKIAPQAYTAIKIAGVIYLLYLAYKIAFSGPIGASTGRGTPLSFLEAAAFQWVNPKAWVMAVTSMTVYTSTQSHTFSVILVALVFIIVNLPSIAIWTGMGTGLRRFLADPKRLRMFNIVMALLLIASLYPMLK